MKIPIISSDVPYQGVKTRSTIWNPEISMETTLPAKLGAMNAIQGFIGQVMQDVEEFRKRTKSFQDTLAVSNIMVGAEKNNAEIIGKLRTDPNVIQNPETYFPSWMKQKEDFAKNQIDQIKDPDLKKKAQIALQNDLAQNISYEAHYGNALQASVGVAKAHEQAKMWIDLERPDLAKEIYRDAINAGFFKPDVGQNHIMAVDEKSRIQKEKNNYSKALNMIMVSPTEKTLEEAIKLFDIPEERQAELRKQQRIERDAQERDNKEKQAIASDNEDREISNLYLNKRFSEVYKRSKESTLLTAERKTFWGDHAEAAAKQKTVVDPTTELREKSYINELISKEIGQKTIEEYIITNPRLGDSAKKEELNKLEKSKDKEINKAASRSYEYMKKEIISPKGIAGVIASTIPEDVRANNYAKAQLALDDWIDKKRLSEKPPSGTEILTKAEEIVKIYRPKINQRSPVIEKSSRDMINAFGELGELMRGGAERPPQLPVQSPSQPKGGKKQNQYKSIEEVRNAYNTKELTYDEAQEILKTNFGVK